MQAVDITGYSAKAKPYGFQTVSFKTVWYAIPEFRGQESAVDIEHKCTLFFLFPNDTELFNSLPSFKSKLSKFIKVHQGRMSSPELLFF